MTTNFSIEVLEETPVRATRLLTGVAAVPVIRAQLAKRGLSEAQLAKGRELLMANLSTPNAKPGAAGASLDATQLDAVASLDGWDEPNFAVANAALANNYPDQGEYVFRDLGPAAGVLAVSAVATFCFRVRALWNGNDKARATTRDQDLEGAKLLAERGIDQDELTRLEALVKTALGEASDGHGAAPIPATPLDDEEVRIRNLTNLRLWYDEWAAIARVVVKRRDHLIRLGLAQRRKAKKAEDK